MIEVAALISLLGGVASMVTKFLEVRKASVELETELTEQDRREVLNAKEHIEEISEEEVKKIGEGLIISRGILKRAVNGIEQAEKRFEDAINDIRYTPAQIDQETKIVQATICSYLQLVKDHNGDNLPSDLDRFWLSYKC